MGRSSSAAAAAGARAAKTEAGLEPVARGVWAVAVAVLLAAAQRQVVSQARAGMDAYSLRLGSAAAGARVRGLRPSADAQLLYCGWHFGLEQTGGPQGAAGG